MTDKRTHRRRFLAGMASAAGAVALAGCGGGGSEGSDGSSGSEGSDGSDGSDGSGGSTDEDLTQINISLAPDGWQGIFMDYISTDTNILENQMNERGYTAQVQKSWEGAALFASGGPDFSTISSFEATRLGVERDLNLAVVAKAAPLFMGWWALKGSDYDPNNVGDAQTAIDNAAEGATVGIGSWAGGDVPGYTTVLDEVYGYTFQEGSSNDFDTVTAEYNAIPQLIREGQLDVGGSSPVHGVARHIDENGNPRHAEIFQCAEALEQAGIGVPPLNNLTTTQDIVDNERGAAQAYINAWQAGVDWMYEDPRGRVEEDQEEHLEQLGVNTMAQAQYVIDWGVNLSLDNEYPYVYESAEMTDEWLEQDRSFLSTAEERGFIPSGWQDKVSFVQLTPE